MHESTTKCNETIGKWCKNKHGASKIIDTFETYHSPFWKGIMKVKEEFFSRGSFILLNGESVRFWEDTWLGDRPLSVRRV
jgi:hypothetical protein